MYRTFLRVAFAISLTLATTGVGSSAPTAKDKRLLEDVTIKLLAECPRPEKLEWPPNVAFEESGTVDAYAALVDGNGKPYEIGKGKIYPIIRISTGLMTKVIQSDEPGAE